MQRYHGIIAYDGSSYSGYQIQPNGRTVQEVLEKALKRMHKGVPVKVTASGRTDAGVHARGQSIHFDSSIILPSERWVKALNGLLPGDISIKQVEPVSDDFHARFDVTGKKYKYYLYTDDVRDPIKRHYALHYPYKINLDKIRSAADFLIGTHDFTSFCSAKTEVENKVRTITSIHIKETGNEVIFSFTGNGFLYNMVRIIVGTLLDVGAEKIMVESVPEILKGRDRSLAGKTAPAEGLYLWEVFY